MSKILEKNVKQDFLTEQNLIEYDLGKLGKTAILFEKCLIASYLRADVCLFTQNKGLIGIEIKNKHDNLKRLHRQLIGYLSTCNYVYVLCHKNHLKGVKQIVKSLRAEDIVGIIVYSEFDGLVVPGLYRSAHKNSRFDLRLAMNVIWYDELMRLLIANFNQTKYQKSSYGLPYRKYESVKASLFTYKHPTKKQVIEKMIYLLGHRKCIRLINDLFIYHDTDPEQHLQKHQFKKDKLNESYK